MHICTTVAQLQSVVAVTKSKGLSIGFVPTMGALHQGHLSLLAAALKKNDFVISSIFVNPAQFNDKSDLDKYPRMPEADTVLLEKAGCNCLFIPGVADVYPPDLQLPSLDFGFLEHTMEGIYRPGHFKGMAAVVYRLFSLTQPDDAYFGEKDFQQLAIIREMTRQFQLPVTINGCPTLREPDGLAMSSRNLLLSTEQRREAPLIYQTLSLASGWLREMPVEIVRQKVIDTINASASLTVQYFEIVNPDTLQPITALSSEARGCIAVLTDGPRLIDNVCYLP